LPGQAKTEPDLLDTNMRITYFANAMIMLEGKQSRVLCDPWVTFDRQSSSGLFTFPELRMSREEVAALAPHFIYISHTHADHFDPTTLALFPSSTPILIAKYAHNFTERNVRALGFTDVRVVDPINGQALNGEDWCWIEPNAVYPEVDSLLVVRIDGRLAANLNDNPFDQRQCEGLARRFGQMDLACVPFSFQGPYPAFYENLSEQERATEAEKKKLHNFETMTRFAETLKARRFFPFAAGALYAGAKARLFPYYGVGTCSEAIAYAQHRVKIESLLLSQRCSYNFASGEYNGTYRETTYTDQLEYIEAVAGTPSIFDAGGRFWVAPSERIDLTKLLQRARQRQIAWQKRRQYVSDSAFFLDVGETSLYRLNFADETVTRVIETEIRDPVYEIFRIPYSLLIGSLTGHYNWSNIKTQHISFYRKPNVFNPDLHILMSYLQL